MFNKSDIIREIQKRPKTTATTVLIAVAILAYAPSPSCENCLNNFKISISLFGGQK